MYYKQISIHFHWIHIEIAQYFMKKGQPQIAHFILEEALHNKVFDALKIKEAMRQIPTFEKKYSKGDMLAVLNLKNIKSLAHVWNPHQEEIFYLKNLPSEYVIFEHMKIVNYEMQYGIPIEKIDLIKIKLIPVEETCTNEVFADGSLDRIESNQEAAIENDFIKALQEPNAPESQIFNDLEVVPSA